MPDQDASLKAASNVAQQNALALDLVRHINAYVKAAEVGHDIVLGALISTYRAVALQFPCCLGESARITRRLADDLIAAHLGHIAAAIPSDRSTARH